MKAESVGSIEPVSEISKHTIKAFMNFISSDFSSLSHSTVFSNIVHDCSRFEFYKYCLDEKLKTKENLMKLFEIEKEIMISECEVTYTIGSPPLMKFSKANEKFFLRIELFKNKYKIVGYNPGKKVIGKFSATKQFNNRENTFYCSVRTSDLNVEDVFAFIEGGKSNNISRNKS